ncbi:MAG: Molecular chaperone [Desulfotomaculum sp. 46_80]|nr:MAG: Molecular chaperone [Desulfotomaculum sp. 46_80]
MDSMVRWNPMKDLSNLRHSINRIFDENLSPMIGRTGTMDNPWTFPVDIHENEDNIIVRAEIPGLEKDEIKVHFVNNQLSIQGERANEQKKEDARFLKIERSYGSFYRSFNIDFPIKEDAITANYKNGMLEITLPKKEGAKPKRIPVDVSVH